MAVEDDFQGKGIGSLLLERLAVFAVRQRFRRFWAVTAAENQPMLDVFRNSGFESRSRTDAGYVEIDLSVVPSKTSIARAEFYDRVATVASLRPFFRPDSVAIVGASRHQRGIDTRILNAVIDAKFKGAVYPVNPGVRTIAGLPAYASVRALPSAPDLVLIAVPARLSTP